MPLLHPYAFMACTENLNGIHISIVTDKKPSELNEIPCLPICFGPRLFCLSFDIRIFTKYRRENLIWSVLFVL